VVAVLAGTVTLALVAVPCHGGGGQADRTNNNNNNNKADQSNHYHQQQITTAAQSTEGNEEAEGMRGALGSVGGGVTRQPAL
jgi:hypothetical protein